MLHGSRLILRLSAGLVAGLAIGIALIWWRLASGPLSLDFLVPWVEQALAPPGHGVSVTVQHTELNLDSKNHTLEILADGARIKLVDGSAELALPRVALNFSLRAALTGEVAPTRVVLVEPELRLVRAVDGTIHLGLGEGSGAEALASDLLSDLAPAAGQQGAAYLRTVLVRDASVVLEDRALGFTWNARADASLDRDERGISGSAQVALSVAEQTADFAAQFQYRRAEHRLEGGLAFVDLNPANFAAAAPALARLAAVQLPLSGRIRLSLDTDRLRIDSGEGSLVAGSGHIDDPRLANGTLAIRRGEAKLAYDPAAARLAVQRLDVDLGGPRINVTGEVDGLRREFFVGAGLERMTVSAKLLVTRLPIDAFARYWPADLSPSSRAWVTGHLHDGVIDEASANVGLVVDPTTNAARPLQARALAGSLSFRNLTVDYFPPLAPIRGVDGTGSFDLAHFDLATARGSVNGLKLSSGTVQLSKLDTNDEQIAINASVAGPLRDALDLLDSRPLRYAHAIGVDPGKTSGNADAQLNFRFPLIRSLKIEDVDYEAKAALKTVAVTGLVFGHDLSAGDLKFTLDRTTVRLQGTGEVDHVPAAIGWTQSLRDGSRHYTLKARMGDAERRRFGIDYFAQFINGPVDLDVACTLQKGNAEAEVDLGLRDAKIDFSKLAWSKPAGVDARAQLKLLFAGERLTAIQQGTIRGDTVNAVFAANFLPATGALQRVEVRRLALGATDVSGWIERPQSGGWSVTATGKSLDATRLLNGLGHGDVEEVASPLALNLKVDRLILGPQRELRNVSLRFRDAGGHWQTVVLDGGFVEGGALSVRFGDTSGPRNLRIASDNLGAALRLLRISDAVVGGRITVLGQAEDVNGRRIFGGHVDGEDYLVQKAPTLARVLSIGSFSGAANLLQGKGIPFTRLRGDYVFDAGRITISEARAYGGAIGVNAGGMVDIEANTLDLAGVIIPAYTLNSALRNVPFLGPLLLGPDGGGVFGINFRVAGAADDPKVSVNPLSAVAPGFLRKLFLFDAPRPSSPPANDVEGPNRERSSGG